MDDQAAQAPSRQLDPTLQQATSPAPQTTPAPQDVTPVNAAQQAGSVGQQVADLNALTSVLPQATQQTAQDQLNPANAISGKKELTGSSTDMLSALAQEVPGSVSVEQERTPEISPEVESWMESVDRHEERPPEKVVVADQTANNPTGNYAADPVIVLPLTQTKLQQGMKHSVQDSVKWLAVWCVRIIKKFHGAVVYQTTDTAESKQ